MGAGSLGRGLDHDDFELKQSKITKHDRFKSLERDAGGKSLRAFPHPALTKTAATLSRRAALRYPVIRHRARRGLWFLTDPARTPDPAAIAEHLPAGAVVIYRTFGDPGALACAQALRRITCRRGLLLLIGADCRLARKVGADGVHLPQRLAHQAGRLRRARPDWLITGAAHSLPALLKAERWGVEAVLISAVFSSRSSSAGRALNVSRFQALAQKARGPVIALGGVNARTATRLRATCAAGLAGVDVFGSNGGF